MYTRQLLTFVKLYELRMLKFLKCVYSLELMQKHSFFKLLNLLPEAMKHSELLRVVILV